MNKYRKKPIIIEAVQYNGENIEEIKAFMVGGSRKIAIKENSVIISTLEGDMTASKGDFIIRGVSGEYYPCKPDIFEKTYEMVKNKKTNFDTIKQMSIEKMTEFITLMNKATYEKSCFNSVSAEEQERVKENIKQWLESEAENE